MNAELGNARAIEAWNTVLFEKFSRYEHLLVQGLGAARLTVVRSLSTSAWSARARHRLRIR